MKQIIKISLFPHVFFVRQSFFVGVSRSFCFWAYSYAGLENREYGLGIRHTDHVAPSIHEGWH
jgi:hypothetical protein